MNVDPYTRNSITADDMPCNGNVSRKPVRSGKNQPSGSGTSDSSEYCMDHPRMGKCLIFNHQHFGDPRAERKGTKCDADALESVFKELDFVVVRFNDLRKKALLEELQKAGKDDHQENNCFVCCILTHGEPGILWAADEPYDIGEVFAPFYGDVCESLADKPKIFFIQACQGDETDRGVKVISKVSTDSTDDLGYNIKTHPDFSITYGTVPGYYSWRDEKEGAWFIQTLCHALHEHARDMDLLKILTLVNQRVSFNYPTDEMYHMKQVPCITSTLIKEVKFPTS